MADSELLTGLRSALTSVGKTWKREKLHHDRVNSNTLRYLRTPVHKQTVKDAAFQVMEEAINKASSDGGYLANARQIMYAARPLVLKITGGNMWTDSAYFTQNILKDYIEEHEGEPFIENIVWDSRGHVIEPHTKKIIPLGGAAVANYIEAWSNEFDEFELPELRKRINTIGPKFRFNNALFIEKEGFDEIIEASGIPKKYDIARLSTKGIPVEAACKLVNQLSSEGVKILVLHDFDFAGFKIVRTLEQGTRLSEGTSVIDIGFRMADIQGLQSEEVQYRQHADPRWYLKKCGATEEERNFLVNTSSRYGYWSGQRVELNAMLSNQFIAWLEKTLIAHGVQKVIPDEKIVDESYQGATFRVFLKKEIRRIKEEFMKKDIDIPDDLYDRVSQVIKENPTLSWDEAIYQIAEEVEIGRR
jgi:hypothetical protein